MRGGDDAWAENNSRASRRAASGVCRLPSAVARRPVARAVVGAP